MWTANIVSARWMVSFSWDCTSIWTQRLLWCISYKATAREAANEKIFQTADINSQLALISGKFQSWRATEWITWEEMEFEKQKGKYSLLLAVSYLWHHWFFFSVDRKNGTKYASLDYQNQNPFLISLLRLHHKRRPTSDLSTSRTWHKSKT